MLSYKIVIANLFYRIYQANGGSAPLTYQKFLSVLTKIGSPDAAISAPQTLPSQCKTSYSKEYEVPSLEELGVDLTGLGENKYPGGETEALARLEIYMNRQVFEVL